MVVSSSGIGPVEGNVPNAPFSKWISKGVSGCETSVESLKEGSRFVRSSPMRSS